jgi:hypothetical protein
MSILFLEVCVQIDQKNIFSYVQWAKNCTPRENNFKRKCHPARKKFEGKMRPRPKKV